MPPGDRPRGAARRQAIVDAALTLLGRGGSGAVTHRAVASEAGVPLAATTYYFRTKDDLLLEAFALARERDVAALAETALPTGTRRKLTAAAVACWLVEQFFPQGQEARCAQLVLYELELEAARRPELAELSRTWTDAYVLALTPVLARLGAQEPERDAWLVVTALEGISLELLASGVDDPAAATPVVERMLHALTSA